MQKSFSHTLVDYHGKASIVIGWREWIALPDLGIQPLKAKIDTGARTSALHAFDIEPYQEDSKDYVRFKVHPIQRNNDITISCSAQLVDIRQVIDSGGHSEMRHVIATTLVLGGLSRIIEITLTDRRSMNFRMLLGRKALQSYYIIDPKRSYQT